MELRSYVRLWLFLTMGVAFEYLALNHAPQLSFFNLMKYNQFLSQNFDFSTKAGKPLSLVLGCLGMFILLMTNLYIMRKRIKFLRRWGDLDTWLNFHIFCGLMGPTLILFHTDFKIGGLVAMSFWSMVISFLSGVLGRYFYIQLLGQKTDLEDRLNYWDQKIKQFETEKSKSNIEKTRFLVLNLAGAELPKTHSKDQLSLFQSLKNSILGDLRLRFRGNHLTAGYPPALQEALFEYALTERRLIYLEPLRKIMGYWHSFHTPFAVFMYLVALIHIGVALMFSV